MGKAEAMPRTPGHTVERLAQPVLRSAPRRSGAPSASARCHRGHLASPPGERVQVSQSGRAAAAGWALSFSTCRETPSFRLSLLPTFLKLSTTVNLHPGAQGSELEGLGRLRVTVPECFVCAPSFTSQNPGGSSLPADSEVQVGGESCS